MFVRALSPTGDYQLGRFLQNSSLAVAQCIRTRLGLWTGQWFLNTTEGTDWANAVLGYNTPYDLTIQDRILGTPGVDYIQSYSSTLIGRNLSINATVITIYDTTPIVINYNTGF